MAFQFYANRPLIDLLGSFADERPQPHRVYCEGAACGPNRRFRGHHQHRRHDSTDNQSDVHRPAADVYSTETEYKVFISLPSADKETIELTYDPNSRELAVSGTLTRPAEFAGLDDEALKKVLVQAERRAGRFERKLKVPQDENERIRFDEAAAKFDNGVLELTLPKVEKEGPKTIVIE